MFASAGSNGIVPAPSSSPPAPPSSSNRKWTKRAMKTVRRIFPPINGRSLLRHYVPLSGAISHSLFTIHVFTPTIFTRIFSAYDLAASNAVLFNAHLGIGFYMFFRPHMHRLWRWRRVEFSVFASVMFNFGTLLLSIFVKDLLPKKLQELERTLLGIVLSIFMLHRARRYVHYVDQRAVLPSLVQLKNSPILRRDTKSHSSSPPI